jgi:hypothetical protein
MAAEFDREQLLAAFDDIGTAAVQAGTRLDVAVYGGSALMLAGNFRFHTEDVDIAQIGQPWPRWLSEAVSRIALQNGWSEAWFNEAVDAFLSSLANPVRDLIAFGSFPRASDAIGLNILVPSAEYMLALKLMALRVSDFSKGTKDMSDVANLLGVLGITEVEPAIEILRRYFPKSATHADKQRLVLRYVLSEGKPSHAPCYPRRGS